MLVVRSAKELPSPKLKRGFVPTMGALHPGHISLVELAKQSCEEIVVSVFVNPTQFGRNEDLDRYPRREAEDLEMCEKAGVAIFYAPSVEDMYPHGLDAASIHISSVGDLWEGAFRPGHFDGVATVVSKLCHRVQPSELFLGQKDLQQSAIVQRMIDSIDEPYKLIIAPTMREGDGLAMSSRNIYLSPEERTFAPKIYQELSRVRDELLDHKDATQALASSIERLQEHFEIQYLALIDRLTFQQTDSIDENSALIFAGYLGKTRLIDNVLIF